MSGIDLERRPKRLTAQIDCGRGSTTLRASRREKVRKESS